jgi:hypothetical protein
MLQVAICGLFQGCEHRAGNAPVKDGALTKKWLSLTLPNNACFVIYS